MIPRHSNAGGNMNITGLGRASLKVRDLKKSARFYSDILRMPVISESQQGQVELRAGRSNGFVLESSNPRDSKPAIDVQHVAFVIGNNPRTLQAAASHLSANGVAFSEVAHEEYESLYLRDPDGHLIELYYWPEW